VSPVYQPDERPHRARPRRGRAVAPRHGRLRRCRPGGAPPQGRLQEPNPFPKSIRDNVAQGLRVYRFDDDLDERVEQALKHAALWEEAHDQLEASGLELSGGPQRLCIARAIAADRRSC